MKLKFNVHNWILYIILTPFLYPRGFSEYIPAYKSFFTFWLYGAVVYIFLLFLFGISQCKVSKKISNLWILLYFTVMIVLTFIIRGSFSEGLQKLFATPALCVFCALYLKRSPKRFIRSVNNLLIILFLLNLFIFNPIFWKLYFSPITNHITFFGHVQISAQLGTLGVFFAYLDYELCSGNRKRLSIQILLSVVTMISSFTSAAYIVCIFLIIFWLLMKTQFQKIYRFKGQIYLIIYILINLFFFWFINCKGTSFSFVGFSLNGRGFIWYEAIKSFLNSPIYGYGVHGVLIKVFWSFWVGDGQGMNYMHNQILQILNDGGIILFIIFVFMLYSVIKNLDVLRNRKLRCWSVASVLLMLFIMIIETVMEYFYMFFILMTVTYLPDIQRVMRRKN